MSVGDIFYCIILIIVMLIAISVLLNESRAGISPTPTMPGTRRVVLDLLAKYVDINRPLKVAELGSGWGGLAIKIANRFPLATIIGFEISPWPFILSRVFTSLNKRITISKQDFFDDDWNKYDVLVCYLSPKHMQKIEEKILRLNQKPIVISCAFPMPNSLPTEIITIRQIVNVSVYVYC
jgi:hypothetical protein